MYLLIYLAAYLGVVLQGCVLSRGGTDFDYFLGVCSLSDELWVSSLDICDGCAPCLSEGRKLVSLASL